MELLASITMLTCTVSATILFVKAAKLKIANDKLEAKILKL